MKLYTYVVLIVCLTNLAVMLLIGYLINQSTTISIQKTVEQTQTDLAGQMLYRTMDGVKDRYAQIKRLAKLSNLQKFLLEGNSNSFDYKSELQELTEGGKDWRWLAVYDNHGQQQAMTEVTSTALVPQDLLEQAIKEAEAGRAWRSRLVRREGFKEPVMLMSAPVYKQTGEYIGCLIGSVNWSTVLSVLHGNNQSQNVNIFNKDGYLVGSNQTSADPQILIKRNDELVSAYINNKDFYQSYIGPSLNTGEQVLAVVVKYKDTDVDDTYLLLVEMPEEFIFAGARLYALELFLFILAAIIISAIIMVWLINYRVIKPVKALTETARDITRGQYNLLAEVVGHDEISQLATSFNAMTKSLAQAGRYLREIVMTAPTAVFVTDGQGAITMANQAAVVLLAVGKQEDLIGQEIWRFFVSKQRSPKARFQELLDSGVSSRRTLTNSQKIKIAVNVSLGKLTVDDSDTDKLAPAFVFVVGDMRESTQYAKRRLAEVMPVLKAVAAGDFSQQIKISPDEDEFAEHFVALNMMIEDFRSLVSQIQTKQSELTRQNETLAKLSAELRESKSSLESRVVARTKDLEDAKKSLEIKVAERTKELSELNAKLEQEVARRTIELQEKLLEVERFNRLAVGRELKMINLKQELARLKERLQ